MLAGSSACLCCSEVCAPILLDVGVRDLCRLGGGGTNPYL